MLREKIISKIDKNRLGRAFGFFDVNKTNASTKPWTAPISKIISTAVKDDSTISMFLFQQI
jgi:hypothetical protein